MLQMFEQKKTKNMKDALGRTGGAIPKRREPESCQPIIFLWSQHHNKFSWELITTFFLAAILRHEFLMFEHNQEKNKDALGCSGCAPGGWPSSCKKITYIRLQNAECLRAVPTFQSYWCSLDMYWQAELKECEDASVTLLEGFFLTTASIGKNIKIDSWRLKKAWWCQDRNDFHNWNMGLSKVGN